MPIVEPLKRFREQFRLTQNDVAAKLGIKQASYAQYEQKKNPSTPSADTIIKLAKECNVSADYLLGLSDNPNGNKNTVNNEDLKSVAVALTQSAQALQKILDRQTEN